MSHFRTSYYNKNVWIGKRTVKEGECAALWRQDGTHSLIVGPRRFYIWFSTISFLDRFVADQHQYLVIQYKDGKKEHCKGPLSVFKDPVKHESVRVENAIEVNSFEIIVVYSDREGAIERRLIKGPTVFIPEATEWLQTFEWTNPEDTKKPATFVKLPTISGQFSWTVGNVRTQDDAIVSVNMMLFYKLENVELMLDATQDPIGDLTQSLTADLITFGSSHTYEDFLRETSILNDFQTYLITGERARSIGFEVQKIVYCGYKAQGTVQEVHDNQIKLRTKLKHETEVAEQKEKMMDFEIERKIARSEKERQIQIEEHQQELRLSEAKTTATIRKLRAEHEERMRQRREEMSLEKEKTQMLHSQQIEYLKSLEAMGVNLTQYLVAQNKKEPDQIIKLETEAISSSVSGPSLSPHVHVHPKK